MLVKTSYLGEGFKWNAGFWPWCVGGGVAERQDMGEGSGERTVSVERTRAGKVALQRTIEVVRTLLGKGSPVRGG